MQTTPNPAVAIRQHGRAQVRCHRMNLIPEFLLTTPIIPMNHIAYIKGFAWIAIVALCCSIFSDYWLPMIVGAVVVTLILRYAR